MATLEKAVEFLESTGSTDALMDNVTAIFDQILKLPCMTDEMDEEEIAFQRKLAVEVVRPFQLKVLKKTIDLMAEMYVGTMTDEELDIAIAYNKSDVAVKLREVGLNGMAEYAPKMVAIIQEEMPAMEAEISTLVDAFMEEEEKRKKRDVLKEMAQELGIDEKVDDSKCDETSGEAQEDPESSDVKDENEENLSNN